MYSHYTFLFRIPFLVTVLLLLTSCSAGNIQFSEQAPAGFWWGLWHGIISFIALIIHIFNDAVMVYEVDNTGGWYDLGFLLGVACIWGGCASGKCKAKFACKKDDEWDEIGDKVEAKIMRKLKDWADDDNKPAGDEDWEEVAKKAEEKLKRKIREWAEKE